MFILSLCYNIHRFHIFSLTLSFCPKEKVTGHETLSVPLGDCPDLGLT